MTKNSALAFTLLYGLVGCQNGTKTQALHDLAFLHHAQIDRVTADLDFFRTPFPDDARREADGSMDLHGLPRIPGVLTDYLNLFEDELGPVGLNPTIHFRFDGALTPYSQTGSDSEPARLVNITANSPAFDQAVALAHAIFEDKGEFIGPHSLALRPVLGVSLLPSTTYAALITDDMRDAQGSQVRPATELNLLLAATAPVDAALQDAYLAWAPLRSWLAIHPELRSHLVNATVFTTGEFTSTMAKLRQAVRARPVPALEALSWSQSLSAVDVYEGHFISPNFQAGIAPYLTLDSAHNQGRITFDPAGAPIVTHDENLRVALSVPQGVMPASGWPLIVYAHGTGGDYKSFVREGLADGLGAPQANSSTRFAMISVDQVLHGPRDPNHADGGNFFNLFNLVATRDNHRQAGADLFSLVQLSEGIQVATAPGTGKAIRFDPAHIYFLGHSQGSITGSLFLSAEPKVRAAGLSGCGGLLIYTFLDKVSPVDIPAVVQGVLRESVDEFHPILGLVEQFFESADPVNYAPLLAARPTSGAKSLFLTWGVGDTYTPRRNNQAFAAASRVAPVLPLLDPPDHLAYFANGQNAPIAGNIAAGQATAIWVHYQPPANSDGHFVLFENPAALPQFFNFLSTDLVSNLAEFAIP